MNPLLAIAIPILRKQAVKLAKKVANDDMPDAGLWMGKYTSTKLGDADQRFMGIKFNSTEVFRIDLDAEDPLRFVHADSGIQYRPAMAFASDYGSIPWFLHNSKTLRLQPQDFAKSYLQHDSAYLKAGCWVRKKDDAPWVFIPLTRVEADVLLYWGLSAEVCRGVEASRAECQAIYRAVRLGGRTPWRRHRQRESALIARK